MSLEADSHKVLSINVLQNNIQYSLNSRFFILSAGAYFTPVLLQKSKNNFWPKGLANNHDLVGRNLMFHASDFIGIWSKGKLPDIGPKKTIALRDFYTYKGMKLGEFQSTGLEAGYGYILYALRLMYDQSIFRRIGFLRHALRIPAYLGAKLLGKATIFATILEDYPYRDNRVFYDESSPSGMRFEYSIRPELKNRVKIYRNLLRKKLKHHYSILLNPGINLNYGHACGTCRMGLTPSDSVVNQNCKVHEIDNLYIVDASIMPTSGGTNPSLTIAANSLRVADAILEIYSQGNT